MSYNMDGIINRHATIFLLLIVLTSFQVSRCTNTSTRCFGALGLPCTTHRLSCPSPLVIQIINTTYGYRPGCNITAGISNCNNTACCDEEPVDCFVSFSSEDDQRVANNCNGKQSCTVSGFRKVSGTKCGGTTSAYSKIQYDCVLKGLTTAATTIKSTSKATPTPEQDTTSTTQYSTDQTSTSTLCSVVQSDNSGVVGGVLGTLLIISIVINVGLVVYFTRKLKSLSSTPRENNYDGLTNTGRDQPLSTYDDLQVQSTASYNHNDKTKSDNGHTYYNTKGDSLSRNIDPYYVNMKKP